MGGQTGKRLLVGTAVTAIGAAVVAWSFWPRGRGGVHTTPATAGGTTAARPAAEEPTAGLRAGNGDALAKAHRTLTANTGTPPGPATSEQAAEWTELLEGIRVGWSRFTAAGRVAAIETTTAVLDRLAIEGTPAGSWEASLAPSHAILRSGLTDADPAVRLAAVRSVGHLWIWSPGCGMTGTEEQRIGDWKAGFYEDVATRLDDADLGVRLQTIACLGALPLDAQAAPAAARITDPDFRVRLQVLTSFANRPRLLSEEAILPLLHDATPDMASLAERVLKARGVPADLIGLGRMVTHSRPEMRASAIPLLLRRSDIDPVVWLLRLSEDSDEAVRLSAVEAFAGRSAPEVIQRLQEMAAADESEAVRTAAKRLSPRSEGPTAALPPLPGSPRLTPRAN